MRSLCIYESATAPRAWWFSFKRDVKSIRRGAWGRLADSAKLFARPEHRDLGRFYTFYAT